MKITTDHNCILATTVYVIHVQVHYKHNHILHTYVHITICTHYVFLIIGSPEMYVHD